VTVAAGLYDWLLFLHIVAAMVWFGGLIVLGALATLIARAGDREAIARFVGTLRTIGPVVLAPAPVALVGLGVWMVLDTDAWGFGQTWIWLALVLFGAAFLIGAAHQSRAAIAAERSATGGDHAAAARHLRRWSWGMLAILALLLVATWDMVFKPGI
jgi:uncharacterized membrane protein